MKIHIVYDIDEMDMVGFVLNDTDLTEEEALAIYSKGYVVNTYSLTDEQANKINDIRESHIRIAMIEGLYNIVMNDEIEAEEVEAAIQFLHGEIQAREARVVELYLIEQKII